MQLSRYLLATKSLNFPAQLNKNNTCLTKIT